MIRIGSVRTDSGLLVLVVVCGLAYYNGHSLHVEHTTPHGHDKRDRTHGRTVDPDETTEHHKTPQPVNPDPARPHARIRRPRRREQE